MQLNNKFRVFGLIVGVLALGGLVGVMALTVQRAQQLQSTISRPKAASNCSDGFVACPGSPGSGCIPVGAKCNSGGGGGTSSGGGGGDPCKNPPACCNDIKKTGDYFKCAWGYSAEEWSRGWCTVDQCGGEPSIKNNQNCGGQRDAFCPKTPPITVSSYTAISPVGGTTVGSLTPTFSWSGTMPSTNTYKNICIGSWISSNTCESMGCFNVTGKDSYTPPSPLPPGGTFGWLVFSAAPGGGSPTNMTGGCQQFKTPGTATGCGANPKAKDGRTTVSSSAVVFNWEWDTSYGSSVETVAIDVFNCAARSPSCLIWEAGSGGTTYKTATMTSILPPGSHYWWVVRPVIIQATDTCLTAWEFDLPCPSGQNACSNSCVDLKTNFYNCGSCGKNCNNGQTCVNGSCTGGATTYYSCQNKTCAVDSSATSNKNGCTTTGGTCCATNADCAPGQTCNSATGVCSSTTTYYSCQNKTCAVDSSATSNKNGCTTTGGTCCTSNSDCPSGQSCDSTKVPNTCVSDEVNACWGNLGTGTNAGRCYDCNGDGTINILDFSCFSKRWREKLQ